MNSKKTLFILATLLLSTGFLTNNATAQWSFGGSYEIRNEDPQNGFGVRLERQILSPAPMVDINLRGHFSYFNEDNYLGSDEITTGGITNYDYGLAASGGVSVGLVAPYAGMGVGASTMELDINDGDSETSWYFNGFVGAKVSPVPFVKPFVEYRLQATEEYEDLLEDVDTSNGRLIFGVYVTF